jgi:outer membrane biosynthesis protein TonB
VAKKPEESNTPKPTAEKRPPDGKSQDNDTPPTKPTQPATAKSSTEPGFRGNQRKTAIVGSISRTGRSALNVADSPLGRYQAQISRAVEQEWQRNCVRHRDFITPGFLTVRFFVETNGTVRTVRFVGEMETGEVQKGFTLNAIRDADIPPMPAALKKEFEKEALELIFNFYF